MPKTFTAKLHDTFATSVAPDRLTLADPATAEIVPPPQLPVRPLGVATTNPAGIVSMKPIPLREAPAFGLDSVKVKDVVPFNVTLAAPNIFANAGGEVTGGGGGGALYEPPPQAKANKRLGIRTIHNENERSFANTFPGAPLE
jgi:hypothetical protein